jgi:cytochrome c oxidase cbb3-type subunit IV
MMDMNIFRGVITGLLILFFIGLCIWAYSSKRKAFFEEAAWMAVEDEQKRNSSNVNKDKTLEKGEA